MKRLVRRQRLVWKSILAIAIGLSASTVASTMASASASASASFTVESVVAGSNPTFVLNGSGLPLVPQGDLGQALETPYVKVTDSTGILGAWYAGYTGDSCSATIGESTPSTLVVMVNAPSASCPTYSVSAGDSLTITVYDGSGNEVGSANTTAVPPSGAAPAISSVSPPDGPQGGGTFADPGSGQITLSGSNISDPEAVWFGSLASTSISPEGSGSLQVTPPSSPDPDGVTVRVSASGGSSATGLGCAVLQSGACAQAYFFMSEASLSTTVPAFNLASGQLQWNDSLEQTEDNACSPDGNASAQGSFSVQLSGSMQGGPFTVSGSLDSSANDSIPSAFTGNATIDIEKAVSATLTITGQIGDCASIPIPGLTLPDGIGFYLVLGGNVSGTFTENVTVDAGTYSIAGGWIPGSELGLAPDGVDINCSNGTTISQCVQASSTLSIAGTFSANPVWFQIGPPNAYVGVGANVQWITQSSTNGQLSGTDACWGVTWAYQISLPGPLSAYSLNGGGTVLGPWNIEGDGGLCPLGSAAPPTTPPISVTNQSSLPEATVGTVYGAQLDAMGGAGGPYTFSNATGLPNGLTLGSTGWIGGTPTVSGEFDPAFQVTDSTGNSVVLSASIQVAPESSPPPSPLTITTTSLPAGEQGTGYSATVGVNGGVGPYSFTVTSGSLPSGLSLDGSKGTISGTVGASATTQTFTIKVSDPDGQSASQPLTITIDAGPGTTYPVVTAFGPTRAYYLLNQGSITVHWTSSGPSTNCALQVPPMGAEPEQYWYFSTPSVCQSGSYTITSVPAQATNYTFTFCLNEPTPNPDCATATAVVSDISTMNIANPGDEPPATVGQPYCYQMDVSGGVGPYTWSGSGQDGFSVSSSGEICGTPTTAGFPNVDVSVTDTEPIEQTTGTDDEIEVYQSPLAFTTSSLVEAQLDQPYSATIAATGGGCTTPYVSITGLAPGLGSDGEGDITGTPTQGGTFDLTATASVCEGPNPVNSVTEQVELVVSTFPFLVNGPSSTICVVDTTCSLAPSISGGTSPYTWSIASGALPSGMALDTSTGTISGTPTTVGSSPVTIEVTDSSSPELSASFAMDVEVDDLPTQLSVSGEPPSKVRSGKRFTVAVAVEDGSGNVVTTDSTDQVILAITAGTGAKGAVLSCTTNPVTVVDGVADFSCSIKKKAKDYALTASSGSLSEVTTSSFKVAKK